MNSLRLALLCGVIMLPPLAASAHQGRLVAKVSTDVTKGQRRPHHSKPAHKKATERTEAQEEAADGETPAPPAAPAADAAVEAPIHDPNAVGQVAPGADPNAMQAVQDANQDVEAVEMVAEAQPSESNWYGDDYPAFDRVIDHYTAQPVRVGTFNTFITHRNSEGILERPFLDLLGFDGGGLKIGLAVRYGILDRLDAGIYRQNGNVERADTYEFDGRYQLLKQNDTTPLSLALRGGVSWFNESQYNALAGFAECIVNRTLNGYATVGAVAIYHSNSSGPLKRQSDSDYTAGVGVYTDVRLRDYLSVGGEVTLGLLGYKSSYPSVTLGPKFITNRHTFALVVSNTQSMTTDSIIDNTWRYRAKDWILGFNISREL